jgi:hypothetical protein
VEPKVRTWFLRNALEVFVNTFEPAVRERFQDQVPKRLVPLLAPGRLRGESPLATVPLEDAEDLLFAIDSVVGHGAGTSMATVAEQVIARAFADGSANLSPGSLATTTAELVPLLVAAFVDTKISFEVKRHREDGFDDGFTVQLGIPGRPRAARLLRHYSIGAIRAAALRMRDSNLLDLTINDESNGDRATIKVSVRRGASVMPPSLRRPSTPSGRVSLSPNGGSLQLEVERILNARRDDSPSSRPIRRSSPPPRPRPESVRPPGRSNQG